MRIIFFVIFFLIVIQALDGLTINKNKVYPGSNRHEVSRLSVNSHQFETFTNQVKSYGTCAACIAGVSLIKSSINDDTTPEEIAKIVSDACSSLHIVSREVCSGYANLLSEEFEYILKKGVSSYDICALHFGHKDCSILLLAPYKNSETWKVSLPKIKKPVMKSTKHNENGPSLKVLQLSDIHYDPLYKAGANAVCNEPLCCRDTEHVRSPDDYAGKWGDYRNCDIPKITIENLINHIKIEHPDLDYIIWTGDIPPHDTWKQNKEGNMVIIEDIIKLLNESFPDIPVFPCLGNHEITPVDNFPPSKLVESKFTISWFYEKMLDLWSTWLPYKTIENSMKQGGFYSLLVRPGFKIISLNMNFCDNLNWWLVLNSTDPSKQLQWLITELQQAENTGEKVHIIGHIPPGSDDCVKYWSHNFHTIVNRYENTIVAQFYGHTHFDEFEIFYDEANSSRAINIAFIGPSVTSFTDLNPAYRIYYIDGDYLETTRIMKPGQWI